MMNEVTKLFALICILFMLILNKRIFSSSSPSSVPSSTSSSSKSFSISKRCQLGFDRTNGAWHQNRFDEQRFLFHQWRAIASLRRRHERGLRRAYALLLDGDDAEHHYTDAAVAHATVLRRHRGANGADIVLLLNSNGDNLRGAAERLAPLVERVVELRELQYDRSRVELIKHVNKVQLWSLEEYGKLVFIDLDMVLRGSQEHLFAYPGDPTSFLGNPENPYHFNSGITVVEPDNVTYQRIVDTLAHDYLGGWDYTDQALSDAALRSVFGLLPITACPKKRMVYTHAAQWREASASCIHWTGEKPWTFQKRADLQALVHEWYDYMRENVPGYKVPKSDFINKQ
jgi:hypothetical protein